MARSAFARPLGHAFAFALALPLALPLALTFSGHGRGAGFAESGLGRGHRSLRPRHRSLGGGGLGGGSGRVFGGGFGGGLLRLLGGFLGSLVAGSCLGGGLPGFLRGLREFAGGFLGSLRRLLRGLLRARFVARLCGLRGGGLGGLGFLQILLRLGCGGLRLGELCLGLLLGIGLLRGIVHGQLLGGGGRDLRERLLRAVERGQGFELRGFREGAIRFFELGARHAHLAARVAECGDGVGQLRREAGLERIRFHPHLLLAGGLSGESGRRSDFLRVHQGEAFRRFHLQFLLGDDDRGEFLRGLVGGREGGLLGSRFREFRADLLRGFRELLGGGLLGGGRGGGLIGLRGLRGFLGVGGRPLRGGRGLWGGVGGLLGELRRLFRERGLPRLVGVLRGGGFLFREFLQLVLELLQVFHRIAAFARRGVRLGDFLLHLGPCRLQRGQRFARVLGGGFAVLFGHRAACLLHLLVRSFHLAGRRRRGSRQLLRGVIALAREIPLLVLQRREFIGASGALLLEALLQSLVLPEFFARELRQFLVHLLALELLVQPLVEILFAHRLRRLFGDLLLVLDQLRQLPLRRAQRLRMILRRRNIPGQLAQRVARDFFLRHGLEKLRLLERRRRRLGMGLELLQRFHALAQTPGQRRVCRILGKLRDALRDRFHLRGDGRLLALLALHVGLHRRLEIFRLAPARPLAERDAILQIRGLPVGELGELLGKFERLLLAQVIREQLFHLRDECLLRGVGRAHLLFGRPGVRRDARFLQCLGHLFHVPAAEFRQRLAQRRHRFRILAREPVALVFAEHSVELLHELLRFVAELGLLHFAFADALRRGVRRGGGAGRDDAAGEEEEVKRQTFHKAQGNGNSRESHRSGEASNLHKRPHDAHRLSGSSTNPARLTTSASAAGRRSRGLRGCRGRASPGGKCGR